MISIIRRTLPSFQRGFSEDLTAVKVQVTVAELMAKVRGLVQRGSEKEFHEVATEIWIRKVNTEELDLLRKEEVVAALNAKKPGAVHLEKMLATDLKQKLDSEDLIRSAKEEKRQKLAKPRATQQGTSFEALFATAQVHAREGKREELYSVMDRIRDKKFDAEELAKLQKVVPVLVAQAKKMETPPLERVLATDLQSKLYAIEFSKLR